MSNTPVKKTFLEKVKAIPGKIVKAFTGMWHELKKVSWPTRKQLLNYTAVVLVFMLFMGIVIGILDTGATQLVTLLSNIF
ncbi:MAG: preprotein translocase subunit SecE [Eubacteriales bacterium]|nr:preprotein translocase subunit SecE [Eubacteriales bacterium]